MFHKYFVISRYSQLYWFSTAWMLIAAAFFVSCKGNPLPDAGFIDNPSLMHYDQRTPFDDVWFKDGIDFSKYTKILVRPVDTTHLMKISWWDQIAATKNISKEDIDDLADYTKKEIEQAFLQATGKKYELVEQPDANTLIVEIALVEVIPTKIWLNAIGYTLVGALDTGSAAIEGRFRDGGTNEEIILLKDHEHGQYSIVSIADLQWYSHAKHIITHWADEFVQMCSLKQGDPISSPLPFTLRPW